MQASFSSARHPLQRGGMFLTVLIVLIVIMMVVKPTF